MGFRTTGVRLVANVSQYVRDMGRSQRATRAFNEGLDEARLKGARMANELANVSKATSRQLNQMIADVDRIDKQIVMSQKNIMNYARAYAKTSHTGYLKFMKAEQDRLGSLQNARNLLPDPRVMAAAARSFAQRFTDALGKQLDVRLAVAAVPAILAMTPFLSATIAGAVVGGAALGGVIGGVVLAAKDPRVAEAGQDLGRYLMSDLEQRAKVFVDPVLRGITRIRQGWAQMAPDLNKIFASSRFLEPLTDGVIKFTQGLSKGLGDAIEKADGPIEGLRNLISQIGIATGNFFTTMADNAKIGTIALNEFAMAVSNTIDTAAHMVSGAAAAYEFAGAVDTWIDKGRYWLEDNQSLIGGLVGTYWQIDATADGFARGSKEAEAYRKATLGTATANDFAILKQAGMTDAMIGSIDASGTYAAEMAKVAAATTVEGQRALNAAAATKALKEAQQELTRIQQAFNGTLDNLNPKLADSARLMNALKTASDNLYGAQMRSSEANEAYEASWDALSESVKSNGRSLDITTQKGRANRDSVEAMILANQEVYYTNVALGMSLDTARDKHVAATNKIIEHSAKLGLDRTATQKLISTYGQIPPQRVTDVIVSGLSEIRDAMTRVYIAQRAMAEGKPINAVRYEGSAAMRSLLFADGGYTGPGHKHQPAGIVHAGEFVLRKEATSSLQATNPGLLDEMNATGQAPGYASGGLVFPVEKRTRIPFRTNMANTFVMSMKDALAKVTPQFGSWPSSPGAQRGDSGVWRRVVQLIRSTGPMSGSFGNAYRPGDPKWHGSGRAVDWMGYGQDGLASFLAKKRPLELIHRTARRDYAYTRGVNKGSFNNSLMEAHRNHIHIAMRNGGIIREPVMGFGASGRTYSFAENGPERVLSASQTAAGAGTVTLNSPITINAAGMNPQQVAKAVGRELGQLVDYYSRA